MNDNVVAFYVGKLLVFEGLILVLGLLLENYLLNKKSKYSILVPIFFLIYPVFRTPVILQYDYLNWFYKLEEFVMVFSPFIVVTAYYMIKKLLLERKETSKNREIDKMKIRDL